MNARYRRELALLHAGVGEPVEVTAFGGLAQYLDCGPVAADFISAAQRAYVRGDLTIDELERELAIALTRE